MSIGQEFRGATWEEAESKAKAAYRLSGYPIVTLGSWDDRRAKKNEQGIKVKSRLRKGTRGACDKHGLPSQVDFTNCSGRISRKLNCPFRCWLSHVPIPEEEGGGYKVVIVRTKFQHNHAADEENIDSEMRLFIVESRLEAQGSSMADLETFITGQLAQLNTIPKIIDQISLRFGVDVIYNDIYKRIQKLNVLRKNKRDAEEFIAQLQIECDKGYLNYQIDEEGRLSKVIWATTEMLEQLIKYGTLLYTTRRLRRTSMIFRLEF